MSVFDMMKQVRELKRIQKEMARKVVSKSSRDGRIVVEARGDMTVKSIHIDPQELEPGNRERMPDRLVTTINDALEEAKKVAAEDMAKLTGGVGGLKALLGG